MAGLAAAAGERVDLGEENVAHTFRVVARGEGGLTASSTISTPPIQVDDELDIELQQVFATVTRNGERVLGLPREPRP